MGRNRSTSSIDSPVKEAVATSSTENLTLVEPLRYASVMGQEITDLLIVYLLSLQLFQASREY